MTDDDGGIFDEKIESTAFSWKLWVVEDDEGNLNVFDEHAKAYDFAEQDVEKDAEVQEAFNNMSVSTLIDNLLDGLRQRQARNRMFEAHHEDDQND